MKGRLIGENDTQVFNVTLVAYLNSTDGDSYEVGKGFVKDSVFSLLLPYHSTERNKDIL